MTFKEYLIGTCFGCKKCLYCGVELSIRKKLCSCDKTVKPNTKNRTEQVKNVFTRISKPNLPQEQLKYIKEYVARFGYSLDLDTTFKFSFCSACNSTFQRKKTDNTSRLKLNGSNRNSSESSESNNNTSIIDLNESDNNCEVEIMSEDLEAEQVISFNLIIKPFTGLTLPSKWVEIEVSSLDDILADVHHYVGQLTGNKEIMHSEYLVSFKPEKAVGVGARLVDMQDYKKFISDYKKLTVKKKNMAIIVTLKKEQKQKRKVIIILIIDLNNFLGDFRF